MVAALSKQSNGGGESDGPPPPLQYICRNTEERSCNIRCSGKTVSIIARAERDDTRVETRIRLSPKRTSPFKSVGASVQSTAGSRRVRISFSNAGYTTLGVGVRVLATHSIRQFPLHFPSLRHRVPTGSERTLQIVCVCLCVCTLNYPACNAHAQYCHLWPVQFYNNFPHYFEQGKFCEEKRKVDLIYNLPLQHFPF